MQTLYTWIKRLFWVTFLVVGGIGLVSFVMTWSYYKVISVSFVDGTIITCPGGVSLNLFSSPLNFSCWQKEGNAVFVPIKQVFWSVSYKELEQNPPKPPNEASKPPSPAEEALNTELRMKTVAKRITYITPIYAKTADQEFKYLDQYSYSAFTVAHKGKIFLLTNAHVVANLSVSKQVFFNYKKRRWVQVRSQVESYGQLDLAVVDITDVFPDTKDAGILKVERKDLQAGTTPLILFCNPLKFPTVPIGFFRGYEQGKEHKFPWLVVKFGGDGAKVGCSGSPIIDGDGFIRGMLAQANADFLGLSIKGDLGYAIPADVIALLLDKVFFNKN